MTEPERSGRARILLADDDEGFLEAIARVLRWSGFSVTPVPDGDRAILAFEVSFPAQQPYDLIILDLRMPGASGWEVLRHVREHTPPGMEPPRVLLTTGFTVELDLDRVKNDRADGVLLKPFMNTALVKEVRRILSLRHEEVTAPSQGNRPARD